jgi:hypothetical protein
MKKMVIIATVIFSTSSFAQDAEQMREASLSACDAQAAQMPEAQKELVLKTCKCSVENTDYAAMLAAAQSGDMAKSQELAMATAEKCSNL